MAYVKKSLFDRPGWMSTVDAARYFGVDRATLRKWKLAGYVTADRLPNSKFVIFEIASIEQHVLQQSLRKDDPDIGVIERLWARVDKRGPRDCWPWLGYKKQGYGRMKTTGRNNEFSHRLAWIWANGPIPTNLFICHHCDNPSCCNPAHLYAGTNLLNMKDMRERGRSAVGPKNGTFTRPDRRPTGESHGHAKLSDEKVREIRTRYPWDGRTQTDLGREYGVTQTVISAVTRRKTWRRVK